MSYLLQIHHIWYYRPEGHSATSVLPFFCDQWSLRVGYALKFIKLYFYYNTFLYLLQKYAFFRRIYIQIVTASIFSAVITCCVYCTLLNLFLFAVTRAFKGCRLRLTLLLEVCVRARELAVLNNISCIYFCHLTWNAISNQNSFLYKYQNQNLLKNKHLNLYLKHAFQNNLYFFLWRLFSIH